MNLQDYYKKVVLTAKTNKERLAIVGRELSSALYQTEKVRTFFAAATAIANNDLDDVAVDMETLSQIVGQYSAVTPVSEDASSIIQCYLLREYDTAASEIQYRFVVKDPSGSAYNQVAYIAYDAVTGRVKVVGSSLVLDRDPLIPTLSGIGVTLTSLVQNLENTFSTMSAYVTAAQLALNDRLSVSELFNALQVSGVNVTTGVQELCSQITTSVSSSAMGAGLIALIQRNLSPLEDLSSDDNEGVITYPIGQKYVESSLFMGLGGLVSLASTAVTMIATVIHPVLGAIAWGLTSIVSSIQRYWGYLGDVKASVNNGADIYCLDQPFASRYVTGLPSAIAELFPNESSVPAVFTIETPFFKELWFHQSGSVSGGVWVTQSLIVPCLPVQTDLCTALINLAVGANFQVSDSGSSAQLAWDGYTVGGTSSQLNHYIAGALTNYWALEAISDSELDQFYYPTEVDDDVVVRLATIFSVVMTYVLTETSTQQYYVASGTEYFNHLTLSWTPVTIIRWLFTFLAFWRYGINHTPDFDGAGNVVAPGLILNVLSHTTVDQLRGRFNGWDDIVNAFIPALTVVNGYIVAGGAGLPHGFVCDMSFSGAFTMYYEPPTHVYPIVTRFAVSLGIIAAAVVATALAKARLRRAFATFGSRRLAPLMEKHRAWMQDPMNTEKFTDLYLASRRYNWFAGLWGLGQFNPTAGFTTNEGSVAVQSALATLSNVKIGTDQSNVLNQISLLDIWKLITGSDYPDVPTSI